jgi:lipopolysaccharide biosynthesis protein
LEKTPEQRIKELEEQKEELLAQKSQLLSSTSWKITKPVRLAGAIAKKVKQKKNAVVMSVRKNPRLHVIHYPELNEARRLYEQNQAEATKISRSPKTITAVVIHLYYTEAWPAIKRRISILEGELPFDLFVTLPPHNNEFEAELKKDYPNANIFEVPNRGRDVLPFVQVASRLQGLGYEYVLKLHSKKSPHRDDGSEWFSEILDNLLPGNREVLRTLIKTLSHKDTGIIGPRGQYISLVVNYIANSFLLHKVLTKLYSKETSRHIEKKRKDYGFFAGTMFWARLDALEPLLAHGFGPDDFEREKGHIDATMAHALERAFCLTCELNNNKLYEISAEGIVEIPYKTDNIPEWSDLHTNYKKKKLAA